MSGSSPVSSTPRLSDPYVLIFSLTLLTSAGLMFTLQPMVGKMLLPLVGGAPSGWLVAMAFFQIMLLTGYWLAHRMARLPPLHHAGGILLLLLLGLVMLPVTLGDAVDAYPALPDALRVFLALGTTVSLPFLALATLSPSLQRLFAASPSRAAANPYFLFAASNLGSFGGLLAYPFGIELLLGLHAQTRWWMGGYIVLTLLCAACCMLARPAARMAAIAATKTAKISLKTRGRWVLLAFVPSSLMVGVTSYIMTDIGGVPFFWVMPLGLYLLTFVVAFAGKPGGTMQSLPYYQVIATALLVFTTIKQPLDIYGVGGDVQLLIPLAVFTVVALQCHFTLSMARPAPARLTEFYLWISIGGALGGIFNAFIAPVLFPLPKEFLVVVLLSLFINPQVAPLLTQKMRKYIPGLICCAFLLLYWLQHMTRHGAWIVADMFGHLALLMCLLCISVRPRIFVAVALALCVMAYAGDTGPVLRSVERNFFGVLRVYDFSTDRSVVRGLYHGSTIHGREHILPMPMTVPSGYYNAEGPVGDLMQLQPWHDIGVLGMGTAQLDCYQAEGRRFTFYEIDPLVPAMAEKWFDFIKACGEPAIEIGDGRRLLAAKSGPVHDLLIMDAFTSDAVPVHLITVEAIESYFDRLTPDGILAVHISNRFYNFSRPLSNAAHAAGFASLGRKYIPTHMETNNLAFASFWVVIARKPETLEPLRAHGWKDLPAPSGAPWTDDYSNVLTSLQF